MKKLPIPNYLIMAFWLTIVNLLILFTRNQIITTPIDDTLLLNLFHGSLPLVIAFSLNKFYHKINNIVFWVLSFVWVLYYPNSPYMISGLKHISADALDIQNYDVLIIFSLAMLSMFYGFLSLKIMFQLFMKKKGPNFAVIAITISLLLSCLGFYMGRVLFLFSADFFKHPLKIVKQVWGDLFPIGDNLSAYALMFLFGITQFMLIIMFKDVNDVEARPTFTKRDSNFGLND